MSVLAAHKRPQRVGGMLLHTQLLHVARTLHGPMLADGLPARLTRVGYVRLANKWQTCSLYMWRAWSQQSCEGTGFPKHCGNALHVSHSPVFTPWRCAMAMGATSVLLAPNGPLTHSCCTPTSRDTQRIPHATPAYESRHTADSDAIPVRPLPRSRAKARWRRAAQLRACGEPAADPIRRLVQPRGQIASGGWSNLEGRSHQAAGPT
eukprot:363595-Chlamydomonas_euryale.AAC.2